MNAQRSPACSVASPSSVARFVCVVAVTVLVPLSAGAVEIRPGPFSADAGVALRLGPAYPPRPTVIVRRRPAAARSRPGATIRLESPFDAYNVDVTVARAWLSRLRPLVEGAESDVSRFITARVDGVESLLAERSMRRAVERGVRRIIATRLGSRASHLLRVRLAETRPAGQP